MQVDDGDYSAIEIVIFLEKGGLVLTLMIFPDQLNANLGNELSLKGYTLSAETSRPTSLLCRIHPETG